VDECEGRSRLLDQRSNRAGECLSCGISRRVADLSSQSAAYVVEDVDADVVVIRVADLDGLVVIPRQHVSGLEELPVPRRANVLAALRRTTRSVQEMNPGSATRVLLMTGPPASDGHVCFRVLPSGSQNSVDSTSSPA
jgi:diadenosine tetraphosphate (Ap4A) HIT family hydrolase